jgi:FlgD Ig-like domain
MKTGFLNLLLITAMAASLGGLVASDCLALDNLEPCEELFRAEGLPGLLVAPSTTSENLSTELLAAICPAGDCNGSIGYTLATAQKVTLCVYDQRGQEIVQLEDKTKSTGLHQTEWDGCQEDGEMVPEGTYFVMLQTVDSFFIKRMVLDW